MINIFKALFYPISADLYIAVNTYLIPSALPGLLALVTFDTAYLLLFRNSRKSTGLFRRNSQLLLYLLFFYLAFVLYLTVLSRPPGSRTEVDLMPFATISVRAAGNVYAAENILLFIPFGILYRLIPLTVNRAGKCLLSGFMLSVAIETVQFITGRGYLQTDDVILNVFGCFIGYIIWNQLIKLTDSLLLRSG